MNVMTLEVLAVIFLATLIRSTFGFGEGLVAVPLLALVLPIEVAAPVVVLVSITVACVVVIQDWRKIHVRSTGWLLLPTFAGIPLGVALLRNPHQDGLKAVLGGLLVLFSLYSLFGKQTLHLEKDSHAWLLVCGFLAGVLGGAYGMNGPPLVVYGGMRRWSPQHFRATLQGYFLPASLVAVIGYRLTGLWTHEVTHYFVVSLIAAVPAIFIGRALNQRLRGDVFLRYAYVGLTGIGALLVVRAVRHHG